MDSVSIRAGPKVLSEAFSYIYPSLDQLCDALTDLAHGVQVRQVVFLLEPEELELSFTPRDTLVNIHIERSPARSSPVRETVFEHLDEPAPIVLTFWRALRRLQTTLQPDEFRANWRSGFPEHEMSALTSIVEVLKRA